jgi:hypothetical protein
MPKEPKAALSLNSGSLNKREGPSGNAKQKGQEAYRGFTPLGPSWPDYLCLFECYIYTQFRIAFVIGAFLLRWFQIVKKKAGATTVLELR